METSLRWSFRAVISPRIDIAPIVEPVREFQSRYLRVPGGQMDKRGLYGLLDQRSRSSLGRPKQLLEDYFKSPLDLTSARCAVVLSDL
jgi:hypothetical protein